MDWLHRHDPDRVCVRVRARMRVRACACARVRGVQVYALSAVTGAKVWSYSTNDEVRTTPALADGILFVGSDDGSMYAFGVPHQHGIESSYR